MGKSPVGLRTLLCSELRKVGTTPGPGSLERCIGGHRCLKAMCLWLSLRRINGRLGCAMYRGWGCGSRGERCLVGVEDLLVSGSGEGLEGALLGVVEDSILHRLLLNRRVRWRDGLGRSLCKSRPALHPLNQLWKSDPGRRVQVKDSPQDFIALICDGQDGLEEVGVLPEGLVGGVLNRRTLPGVAAASQIDEDHTKGPDIVGSRLVASHGVRVCLLTFCANVSINVLDRSTRERRNIPGDM